MAEKSLVITNINDMLNIFGSYDANINIIRDEFNVNIVNRGSEIKINGNESDVEKAYACLESLLKIAKNGDDISEQQVRYILSMAGESEANEIANLSDGGICVTTSGKIIKPKTLGRMRNEAELTPMISSASICCVTRMVPISDAMLLPTLPLRIRHMILLENSRSIISRVV